jgi:hypothetical protein
MAEQQPGTQTIIAHPDVGAGNGDALRACGLKIRLKKSAKMSSVRLDIMVSRRFECGSSASF